MSTSSGRRSPASAETATPTPASIARRKSAQRGPSGVAPDAPNSKPSGGTHVPTGSADVPHGLNESLRTILSRHELRTRKSIPKSIAVTSALSGEGVTTVSKALATLLANEMSARVCYFDCGWLAADGRSPSTESVSELTATTADLTSLIDDPSLVSHTNGVSPDSPNLVILQARPIDEATRHQLVRSPGFAKLLVALDAEFDHVIFDVPPVLAESGALTIMLCADASLLVVRQRTTTLSQVQQALAAIAPTPNLAVVLNRFETKVPSRLLRMFGG